MEKRKIITIAGKPGSGKSTTSKKVAAELGYMHFSSGDLFRAIAKERGIDVYEVNVLAETEKEIDHQVDKRLQEMGKTEHDLVIDSRMAWHWMPDSFKVYLDLDVTDAAERILTHADPKRMEAEHIPETVEAYAQQLQRRLESETKRYFDLYEANPYNIDNYDLVVDTKIYNIQDVTDQILDAYKAWLN